MGSDLQLRNVTLDTLKYYNIIVKYFLHTVFFVNEVLLEENSYTHKHIVSAYSFSAASVDNLEGNCKDAKLKCLLLDPLQKKNTVR